MVSEADAKKFEEQMTKSDLVFLTPDNNDKIRAKIDPGVLKQIDAQTELADRLTKLAELRRETVEGFKS